MADLHTSSVEKIAFLQEQFRKLIPQRVSELVVLWTQARETGAGEKFQELHRKVHSLGGSAGTFGMPEVSRKASELEQAIHQILEEQRHCSDVEIAFIDQVLGNLHDLAAHANEKNFNQKNRPRQHLQPGAGSVRISLYFPGEEEAKTLMSGLAAHGYNVERFFDLNSLASSYDMQPPDLLIVDPCFAATGEPVSTVLETLNAITEYLCPLMAIADRDDMDARLAAARQGAVRYFSRPLDDRSLLKSLEAFIHSDMDDSYRVLVIDDDDSLAEYYAALLTQSGMLVQTLTRPLEVLEAIQSFRPELILLDVYMEGCSGLEVAAVIRQDDAHATIPIVFLSTEARIEKQLAALNLGGDNFLTKPILPRHLIQVVSAHLHRSRQNGRLNMQLRHAISEGDSLRFAMGEHDLVSITDVQGNITYANDMFCKVSGYTREELVGSNHRIVNSGLHDQAFFLDMWETIAAGRVWNGVIRNRAKDGRYYWVNSTIVPFLDDYGVPYQYVAVRTDITSLKETEASLREQEHRLRLSQEFAGVGVWELDLGTDELFLNDRASRMFGFGELEHSISYTSFLECVYPGDRNSVKQGIAACVEKRSPFDLIHRYVLPGGSIRWMEEKGDMEFDEWGQPLRLLGLVQDVTSQKQMEDSLARQKMLVTLLHNGLADFMMSADIDKVSKFMLEGLVSLTESDTGIIARVRSGEDDELLLEGTVMVDCNENNTGDDLNPEKKKMLVAMLAAMVRDPRGQILVGTEEIDAVMGADAGRIFHTLISVPVFYSNQLVGVYMLANNVDGYVGGFERLLNMFNVTFGVMVRARNSMDQEAAILQQLVLAKDTAEEASKAKSQFLSSMSHELRTPMNAILGFGQLLEMDEAHTLTDEQKESVREIISAGRHLLELINEVLDLSRIEAGRVSLNMEEVTLSVVLDQCMTLMSTLAHKQHVTLHYDPSLCTDLSVRADFTRLKQVIINLVSNGIKYNVVGGEIFVECRAQGEEVLLEVRDTGQGIDESRFEELFKPFNRLGAEATSIEGTGIGLVITKQLVELMGGRLELESTVGVGSTFRVVMQAGELQDPRVYVRQMSRNIGNERRFKLLYIEDNPVNLKLVQQFFALNPSIELASASDAYTGLDLITRQVPDLVLLDIDLPGMNGFELLAEIRSRSECRNVPVIAVSANAMPRDVEKGLAAGFDEYIVKPVDLAYLQSVVKKTLEM